jgi:hypothetical protein
VALGGHYGHPGAVTANGGGNAELRVETVKYGVGASQYGARLAMQQGACRQVAAGS